MVHKFVDHKPVNHKGKNLVKRTERRQIQEYPVGNTKKTNGFRRKDKGRRKLSPLPS